MQASSALDILLVDDDRPLREMLTRSFEREGHRVTAVGDGDYPDFTPPSQAIAFGN